MVGGSNPPPGTRSHRCPVILLAASVLGAATTVHAASIAITDSSFEDAQFEANPWTNDVRPWDETDGPENGDAFKEFISGFSADGANHLGLNNGHRVWQDLGETYQSETRYTLTVAVGHRGGFTAASNRSLFRLESPDGTVFAEGEFDASEIESGTFTDRTVSFTTSDVPEAAGESIRVVLTGEGDQRSHFDHIRLEAESLLPPEEPGLGPLSGEALSSTTAIVEGEVVSTGNETPEVTVVYGLVDGGTDLEAWANAVAVGPRDGVFSALLGGLDPEQRYFFRATAENSAGIAWAPSSETFTTLESQPARAVINEFHYKQLDKNIPEEFIELHNPGDTDLDLSGWELASALDYLFPQGTILPAGGYLVVAEDPDTLFDRFGIEAVGPWDGALSSDGESIQLLNADGVIHDRVQYRAGFPWPTAADGEGSSAELLNPALDNARPGAWRASGFDDGNSESAQPTPGAPNSVLTSFDSVPPAIDAVTHAPREPRPGDEVAVSARVLGRAAADTVVLSYQVVEPGAYIRITDSAYETQWTEVTMSADDTAGEGGFTATLSPEIQEHRNLVRYRITATDTRGNSVTVPYADDEQPNFAYFVYDAVPDWRGALEPGETPLETYPAELLENLPVYTLIADDDDVVDSQYNGSYDSVRLPGTFVYDGVVYDHIEFRNRGQASTYVSGKNKWRIYFNTSRRAEFHDNDGKPYGEDWNFLTVNAAASPWVAANRGMAGLDEVLPFRLFDLAGMLSPHTHYFHFRVVRNAEETPTPGTTHGDRLGTADGQYLGDFWGLYYAIEPIRGPFVRERNLPEGNIYKIEGGADKEYQGLDQPADSSDWNEFRNEVGSSPSQQWWEENFELEDYYTFHALNRLLGNVDVRGENNYHLYHRPTDGRWVIIPWDLDMMYIAKSHHRTNIDGTDYPGVTAQHRAIVHHPELALRYRNRAREILDLVATDGTRDGGQIGQLIARFGDIVAPEEPINWANADAAMWNLHPRTEGQLGNASGQSNHLGNFFRAPYQDSRRDGSWTRWLRAPEFEGRGNHADFRNYIRDYVTDTWPGGTWTVSNGDQRGYGYQYLKFEAADSDIPERPSIAYTGEPEFPADGLAFEASGFEDPQGSRSYAATAWRIAEIGARADGTRAYELSAVWESGENTANAGIAIPRDTVEPGRTYRARVRHKDDTGRWSHWSEPVEFTAGEPAPATLLHYWSFNETAGLLGPDLTLTGGSLETSPGAATEFTASTGQSFDGANARLGDPAASHFRVNNPLGAVLVFRLPTTGYEEIVLRYETRRSGQGAGTQIVSISTDGTTFSEFGRYAVHDDTPVLRTLDFSSVPGAAGNPDFAVRITFLQGDGGTAGNNRFDNVTVDGVSTDGAKAPPAVAERIDSVPVVAGGGPVEIDLDAVFSDPEGASLTFSVASDRSSLASAEVDGATLLVSGHAAGEAALTVAADDGVNSPVETVVRALVFPAAHPLETGPFRFDRWDPDAPELEFPEHMIFLQSRTDDPDLTTPLDRAYFIPAEDYANGDSATTGFPYNNLSRTRINGLEDRGISWINTGRGRDVGAAVATLDTRNIEGARLGFSAETIAPNSRVYALRLQYRLGTEGAFHDLPAPSGRIIEYTGAEVPGDTWTFGPVDLPEAVLGHEYVQLAWRYFHIDGNSGPRAEIRLDDVVVTAGSPHATGFETWRTEEYREWRDFIDNTVSGPHAVPRGDGVSNLLRYAFDLNSSEAATPFLPSVERLSDAPPHLRFRFDPGKSDLVWRVEGSTDLHDWTHVVFDSGTDTPPPVEEGWAEIELPWTPADPGSGGSRSFVRLKVRLEK